MFLVDTNVLVHAANRDALLASPSLQGLGETDRHLQVALDLAMRGPLLAGNLMHDAHTAILMREHGVRRIVTRDTDFHRFSWREVVDPLDIHSQ